jgi:hypothetical protein
MFPKQLLELLESLQRKRERRLEGRAFLTKRERARERESGLRRCAPLVRGSASSSCGAPDALKTPRRKTAGIANGRRKG